MMSDTYQRIQVCIAKVTNLYFLSAFPLPPIFIFLFRNAICLCFNCVTTTPNWPLEIEPQLGLKLNWGLVDRTKSTTNQKKNLTIESTNPNWASVIFLFFKIISTPANICVLSGGVYLYLYLNMWLHVSVSGNVSMGLRHSAHASDKLVRVVVLRRVRTNDDRANASWQNQKCSHAHSTVLGWVPVQNCLWHLHVGVGGCAH